MQKIILLTIILLSTPQFLLAQKVDKDFGQNFSQQIISVGTNGLQVIWKQRKHSQYLIFKKKKKTFYSFLPYPETSRLILGQTRLVSFKNTKDRYLLTTWNTGVHGQAIYVFNLEKPEQPLELYVASSEEIIVEQDKKGALKITYATSFNTEDELADTKYFIQTINWTP